jgi:hypothetical protein
MTTIQRIIEIPLADLQTGKALEIDATVTGGCIICGKAIKGNAKMVQLLENGNIVSTSEDVEGSQGFFPVGPDCAKKLVISFTF